MKDRAEVLFERWLEGVWVEALIDVLAAGSVDLLLIVQLALLIVLRLLRLLLLQQRHESGSIRVVQPDGVLMK